MCPAQGKCMVVVESRATIVVVEEKRKKAHSAHAGPDLPATSIQSSIASPHRLVPTSDHLSSPSLAAALLLRINQYDHQARPNNAHNKRSDSVCTTSDPVSIGTRAVGRTLCASPPPSSLGPHHSSSHTVLHAHPQPNRNVMYPLWVSPDTPPSTPSLPPAHRPQRRLLYAPHRDAHYGGEDVEYLVATILLFGTRRGRV